MASVGRPIKAGSDADKIAAYEKKPIITFTASCGCVEKTRIKSAEFTCKHGNRLKAK